MIKTKSGLVIVKKEANNHIGFDVTLTRKTTLSGKIKYGVVITNARTGIRTRLRTFNGIGEAWKLYKTMRAA